MTLGLIEAFKTSIYSPKHTSSTNIHDKFSKGSIFSNIHIFKNKKEREKYLMLLLKHYLHMLRATQPN